LFLTDLDAYGLQVDAALDLSHTQNIGRMIKAHFPHSQVNQVTNFYFFAYFIYSEESTVALVKAMF
jgi:hypothetical protein